MKRALLLTSHALCVLVGLAAGVYALPILIQPTSPDISAVSKATDGILYYGMFERNRIDSDFLHWGREEYG